jgi:hypothetical protein
MKIEETESQILTQSCLGFGSILFNNPAVYNKMIHFTLIQQERLFTHSNCTLGVTLRKVMVHRPRQLDVLENSSGLKLCHYYSPFVFLRLVLECLEI